MPTDAVSPKPTASPCRAASVVSSPAVSPVCAQAVRLPVSISSALSSERSSTIPPSLTLWPALLWPPSRMASSSPRSAASETTWATSVMSVGQTIACGRRSNPP